MTAAELGFVYFHFKLQFSVCHGQKRDLMIMSTVSLAPIEHPSMPKRSLEGDRIEVFLDSSVNL